MANTTFEPKEININNVNYFNADDLKIYNPAYFYGCSRTVRKIISIKNIGSINYAYATWSKKAGWTMSNDQSNPHNKAKLLLKADWVFSAIPKLARKISGDAPSEVISADCVDDSKEIILEDTNQHHEAPPIITLEDKEKFTDNDGKAFDIETRGERTPNGIYFLANDVSNAFDMPKLCDTIKDTRKSYSMNQDYKIFISKNTVNGGNSAYKRNLFITYRGVLKILFSSRSGRADTFIDWATNTLFTAQMGTDDKKEELAAELIGLPAKSLRQILKANVSSVPCIYRFALGRVKALRESMEIPAEIPDDFIIIKYGYTDDLVRRAGEHIRTYEKIPGTSLQIMDFTYIDPKYLSQAEVDIKQFFNNIEIPIKYGNAAELVAINPTHEAIIKKQFKYLYNEFSGSIKDLIQKIEQHKFEMALLKKDMELLKKELENKDMIIACERLKNELLEMKLQSIAQK